MDLYVERKCIEEMKNGDAKKFLLLFDANFDELYKYVSRRVPDKIEVENIVRLTFLDAFGQIQSTPTDISYLVWLYSLAKPRVWEFIAKLSFPEKRGLINVSKKKEGAKTGEDIFEKANKMIGKLSLEEREILRLKFFEEVTDGDVMTVVGIEEGKVGTKIYRVLKRAHFLLFGESKEGQGVYFGELSGLFERIRKREEFEIPAVFKLNLKTDVLNRIDRKTIAIDVELVEEKGEDLPDVPDVFAGKAEKKVEKEKVEIKIEKKAGKKVEEKIPTGSNDPAKIFVEAVREMKEEEEQKVVKEKAKIERKERFYNFVDRWKILLGLIPLILFIVIISIVLVSLIDYFDRVERGYPTVCEIEAEYDGDFSDSEMRSLTADVSDKLCEHFEVSSLKIDRVDEGIVEVEVDVSDWFLEYTFVRKSNNWRIKKYARTLNSDGESGEIQRDRGSAKWAPVRIPVSR